MGQRDTTLEDPPSVRHAAGWVPTLRVLYAAGEISRAPPVELRVGETLLGRGVERTGVLLDDAHASRLHARITVDARTHRAEIANESRRGTEVDGAPVERAELADGAVVLMGHSALAFRWEPRPPPADVVVAGLVGAAPAMRHLRALIPVLGPTEAVVTILGETGTGKEVVARALHAASGRAGPLVAVNCSAIPESLAEAQLFGHVAGAFTGARGPGDGFFRAAAEGTLFLDEVGELALPVQAKLLRALETGAVAPLGAFRESRHGARVITATHRDLADDVRSGRFRGDLYARISDFVVALPPLRARREDVLELFAAAWGAPPPALDFALARALLVHPWPFNVRELVRLAGQVRIRAGLSRGVLGLELAREALERAQGFAPTAPSPAPPGAPPPGRPSTVPPDEREGPPDRDAVVDLLRKHRGVVTDVARAVGRSRKQVYRWVEAYGLDPEAFRSRG